MGEMVNLRKARKLAVRREQQKLAAENRIVHGRGKTERQLEKIRREKAERAVDQHRLPPAPET
jgi:hypothetical protein